MGRVFLWLAAMVAFTPAVFPLSLTVPVATVVAGLGLGWWAACTRLGPPAAAGVALAGWMVLSVWHVIQHLGSEMDRSGELAGGTVSGAGAALLVWAVDTVVKRGNRFAAAGIALAGGLAVLRAMPF